MGYVISVVGAGGKTTLCYKIANDYANKHKKVCVLTTTLMWHDKIISDINNLDDILEGVVYNFGTVKGEKIGPVSENDYKKICEVFDYIIIEADGSKNMPLKIPEWSYEPIIPKNTNEIIIVMRLSAIGRKIGIVCFRFEDIYNKCDYFKNKNISCDTIVSENIIDDIIDYFYVKPLSNKYPNVKINIKKIDITESGNYKNYKKIVLGLCASGSSKRFGDDNKLFCKIKNYQNKELYKIMLDKIINIKSILNKKFCDELNYNDIDIHIAVVSKYDEILNDIDYKNIVKMIKNNEANKGLSSSIKILTKNYINSDAIVYFNSDMPLLIPSEVANMIFYTICSYKNIGCVYTDEPMNPAFFDNSYYDDVLEINGDNGLKSVLTKYKSHIYKYHVDKNMLIDIDTKEDLKKICEF